MTASRRELRALKQAFEESRAPVDKYTDELAALNQLQAKFPASSAAIQREIERLNNSMRNAERPTSLFRSALSRIPIVVDPVSAAFQALRMGANLARDALQGVLTVVGRVSEEMERLDAIAKRAQLLGISEGAVVGFGRAAQDIAGIDAAKFETGFLAFTRRIADAAIEGQGEAFKALEVLGLTAEELAKMKPDEAFLRVADALQKIESPQQRMALSFRLAGDQGREMASLFAAGGDEIRRIADEAARLQGTDLIDFGAVQEANDSMSRLGDSLHLILGVMASEFSPLVDDIATRLSGGFDDATQSGREFANTMQIAALTTAILLDEITSIGDFLASPQFGQLLAAGGSAASNALPGGRTAQDIAGLVGSGFGFLGGQAAQQAIEREGGFAAEILNRHAEAESSIAENTRETISAIEERRRILEEERALKEREREAAAAERKAEQDAAAAMRKQEAEHRKQVADHAREIKRLEDELARVEQSIQTPAEKLKEELDRLIAFAPDLGDELFNRGVEKIRDQAEALRGAQFTGARTIGGIRAGSIEALRSQFSPQKTEEEMLRQQKRQVEQNDQANRLLGEIERILAGGQLGEVP